MTTLIQQIEEMRMRLNARGDQEQGVVKALGDALNRADQRLLDEVRNLTIEHEVRRGAILTELQALASRLGAFPAASGVFGALENASLARQLFEPPQPDLVGDDWARAAANIQDELALPVNGYATMN